MRGQFSGYRNEDGVASDSKVETFAALRFHIDSWRWEGVPFYVRAGKNLPVSATEVVVELRLPPQKVFSGRKILVEKPNYVRFRFAPDVSIAIGANVFKERGSEGPRVQDIELLVSRYADEYDVGPYEHLLTEAMAGNPLLFAREDCVEAAWRIVEPVLDNVTPVYDYEPGSWGPQESNEFISKHGDWHEPELDQ